MSIIYDALEKTQQSRLEKQAEQSPAPEPTKKPRFSFKLKLQWVRRLSYVTAVGLAVGMFVVGVPSMTKFFTPVFILKLFETQKPLPAKPVLKEAVFRQHHQLRGVFFSPQERIAMIDNAMLHEGEMLDGMRVAAIDLQGVTLKNDHEEFVLLSPV